LREIIEGQSNRPYYLAQFVNQEAKNLQWLKVDRRGSAPPPKQGMP